MDVKQNESRDQEEIIPMSADSDWPNYIISSGDERFDARALGSLTVAEFRALPAKSWMAKMEAHWQEPLSEKARKLYRAVRGRVEYEQVYYAEPDERTERSGESPERELITNQGELIESTSAEADWQSSEINGATSQCGSESATGQINLCECYLTERGLSLDFARATESNSIWPRNPGAW